MDNPASRAPEQELPEVYKKLLNDTDSSFLDKYGKYFLLFSLIFLIFVLGSKYITSKDKQKQVAISQPTTAPISISPSPTSEPTANWKTYTNTFYNYSIQYPTNFEIKKYKNEDIMIKEIGTNNSPNFRIYVLPNKTDTPDKLVNAMVGEEHYRDYLTDNTVTWAWYRLDSGYSNLNFFTSFNGNGYEVSYSAAGEGLQEQYITLIKQILSTFKFLDQVQVSITPPNQEATFCAQDAKQCPDGSYVGRTGPNCEFVCPSSIGE